MTDPFDESKIVYEVARLATRKVVKQIIRDMQNITVTLSGDDSGLESAWDEFCVQVQFEQSHCWEAYVDTIRSIAAARVAELPPYEFSALWMQTSEGIRWECDRPSERQLRSEPLDDIVDDLMNERLLDEAGRWSNPRIRAFIERYE